MRATAAKTFLIAAIFVAFRCAILSAADFQWAGTTSTDWNNPANWVGGILPAAGGNARLDVSGGTTDIDAFSDPGFNTTIQQLYIGDANPNATLTQSSGTLNLNGAQAWLKIGAQGGSSGIYNLQGSGILSLTNDVFGIGEHGVGNFNLSDSAQATAPRVALGRYAEGRGTVFQSGGSTLSITGNGNDGNGTPNYSLAIGEQSTALSSYTITGGTLNVSGGNLLIGMTAGSNGRMTVAGSGSAVTAGHEVHVGESGTGTLVIGGGQFNTAGQMIVGNAIGSSGSVSQTGGTLGLTGGSLLVIGNQGGAVGSFTLGGGTLNASGRILVGEDGLGSFTQSGGANNVTQDVTIGDQVGFSTTATPDTYSISGGTLSATSLQIGYGGTGVFTQTGGTNTAGNVVLGGQAGGNGTYSLNGGTLIAHSVSGGPGGSTFKFNGGTLQPSANNVAFFQGMTSAIVQSGGALVNTAGNNVTAAQSFLHDPALGTTADGGLLKRGLGTLTLSGASTYSGGTTVTSGTLVTTASGTVGPGPLAVNAVNGVSSSATLGSSQSVSGLSSAVAGTGAATLNIAAGTTLTVNQSGNTTFAGAIINSGTLAKSGGGTLEIDAAPTLAANSAVQANGGTLRLKVVSGSPTVGSDVTASVAAGATLELAGSVSALAAAANRVNIMNNSQASAGGLLASGSNQQVGAIDGTGNTVVASDASLTSNHIIQNALAIGGSSGHAAVMTIAASDSSGNSRVETLRANPSCVDSAVMNEWPTASSPDSPDVIRPATKALTKTSESNFAVPEPSSAILMCCGLAIFALIAVRRC